MKTWNIHQRGRKRRARQTLRVGVLVERRYLQQPQPSGLIALLEERGHRVHVIDPQNGFYRLDDAHWLRALDVVVARGRSLGVLALLAWFERHGVPTINRHAAIASVHNKAMMSMGLISARIPTPATFFGSPEKLLQTPGLRFPLILKPIFGDNGQGLWVVEDARSLQRIHWTEPFLVAQHYLPNDGCDIKLYGIGEQGWAVRKPSPLHPASKPAELLPLTREMKRLLTHCRRLFGLELLGVDCIQTEQGLVVIEVNEFPTYTGVPNASAHLADWLEFRCRSSVDEKEALR